MSELNSKPKSISSYLHDLMLGGQYYFTLEEIRKAIPIKETSLSVSLSRLSSKGKVKVIRKGFGIITGYTNGSLHPSYFVDAMMNHLNAMYYVGLLSAAAHWGASHQAAMTYFVIANRVIKPISLGRLKIIFIAKRNLEGIKELTKVSGPGGYFLVSSPELTTIDLIRFPKKSGHLNNVATVLDDLFDRVDLRKLKTICSDKSTPTVTLQRLGFILDRALDRSKEAKCIEKILVNRTVSESLLSLTQKEVQKYPSQFPFDEKWKIYENTTVEPD